MALELRSQAKLPAAAAEGALKVTVLGPGGTPLEAGQVSRVQLELK